MGGTLFAMGFRPKLVGVADVPNQPVQITNAVNAAYRKHLKKSTESRPRASYKAKKVSLVDKFNLAKLAHFSFRGVNGAMAVGNRKYGAGTVSKPSVYRWKEKYSKEYTLFRCSAMHRTVKIN